MATVHTAYGPGRIIDQETVRGRTQYKVAGEGFEVWLDESKIERTASEDVWHDQPNEEAWYRGEVIDAYGRNEPENIHELRHKLHADELDDDDPARYSNRRHALSLDEWADRHLHDIIHDDPHAHGYHDDEGADLAREYGLGEHGDYDDDPDARFAARHQAWAPIDHDNSTELPYNPSPQHDAVGSPGDEDASTIQPTHHIDPDERLHNSDSISFDDEDGRPEPGPNPDLFAKQAIVGPSGAKSITDFLRSQGLPVPDMHRVHDALGDRVEDWITHRTGDPDMGAKGRDIMDGGWEGLAKASPFAGADYAFDRTLNKLDPGYNSGWGKVIHDASLQHDAAMEKQGFGQALIPLIAPALRAVAPMVGPALRSLAPMAITHMMDNFGFGGGDDDKGSQPQGGQQQQQQQPSTFDQVMDATDPGDWNGLIHDANYRPAGLSDKYIDLTASADYHNDPVAQFRHDPDAYINRIGHLYDEGLNPRFAEYMDLIEGDSSIRTAAWKDVRKKAMRLKREGHVTVKDIAPNRIMASVVGDHGTYDVVILKNGGYGGLTEGAPGHAISNWHCGCEWGKWAFRRKFTYVGRLCSHAYASYLTMQSEHMKGKPRQQRQAPRKAPARSLPYLHVKRADALQNGPERLTPDLVINDTDDAQMFADVTKDERHDVGPDDVVSEKDIVHFARLMRHCEATEQPYPRQLVAFLARYADCADDSQTDYKAHDADDAEGAINRLREFADSKQSDDFGNMADRVHAIQDAVEEARDKGVDASQFVAMLKRAENEGDSGLEDFAEGVANGARNWGNSILNPFRSVGEYADSLFTGDPYNAPNDNPYGSPIDIGNNDKKGTPGLPGRSNGDSSSSSNDDKGQPAKTGPGTSALPGQALVDKLQQKQNGGQGGNGYNGNGGSNSGGGNAGGGNGGGWKAPAGGTQGPVSDGGVAGAENGNNAAITKDQLDENGYYTVQKGDTATDIAQRAYGDMNKYQDIYNENKGAFGGTVDDLTEGSKIKLKDPTGNNGMAGNVTNPAGSSKAVAGPAVDGQGKTDNAAEVGFNAGTSIGLGVGEPVKATTDAVTPSGGTNGQPSTTTTTTDTGTTTTNTGTKPEKAARRRMADTTTPNASDPNQGGAADPAAPDAAAPATDSPAAKPATNPAATTPAAAPGTGGNTPKTIGPSKDETYDPAQGQTPGGQNPGQQPGLGIGRNDGSNPSSSSGVDALGQGMGVASDVISGIGNAASSAMEAVPNVVNGIGGLASGIGSALSLFSSKQDYDNWVRYAYPTADGEGKLEPHTHPFAGSGYPGPLEFSTSEEYADKARKKHDDVTDLGSHDLSTPMGKWQRQSALDEDDFDPYRTASFDEGTDDSSDIVRAFQANLGDTALGAGAGGGSGRFDDFAGAAQGFLRTAGRNYSLAEQSELIREGDKGGAGNLGSLDLRGTHYEDMHTLGW